MNIPTPADPVMEMAERIADELFPSAYDDAEHAAALLAALAAIRATTEAAAAYVDRNLMFAAEHADALRANHHLKGSDDV